MTTTEPLTRHQIKECLFDMDPNDWYLQTGPYERLRLKVRAQYGQTEADLMLQTLKDEIIEEMR